MKKIFKNIHTDDRRGYAYYVRSFRNGYWANISDLETLLSLNFQFYEENI